MLAWRARSRKCRVLIIADEHGWVGEKGKICFFTESTEFTEEKILQLQVFWKNVIQIAN